MVLGPIRTKSASVKWVVEIYNFDSPVPSEGQFDGASGPGAIIGSKKAQSGITGLLKDLTAQGNITEKKASEVPVLLGITSLRINRSKASPAGRCSINTTGSLPDTVYAGAWVIITSVTGAGINEKRLVRFVGQIDSIIPDYVVMGNGLLAVNSTIAVREWSSILTAPVRYDIYSMQKLLQSSGGLGGVAVAATLLGENKKIQQIQKVAHDSYDPFELAQLILKLIGALNQEDALQKISATDDKEDITLPKLALTMPSIPAGLLARLGFSKAAPKPDSLVDKAKDLFKSVDSESSTRPDPTNPFEAGFAQVLTGMQGDQKIYADGKWDGVFRSITIADYKALLRKNFENSDQRPSTIGPAVLSQLGASAWQLISSYCDPAINEYYTDILYEEGESPHDIVAKPVIVCRDKPFVMQMMKSSSYFNPDWMDLSMWTSYDALPRVRVDNTYITRFRPGNTIVNSPNYIRVNWHATGMDDKTEFASAMLAGRQRLQPEMERFGGQEFYLKTMFLGQELIDSNTLKTTFNYIDWYKTLGTVAKMWHSYNYRTADGVLILKDNNLAVSLGFNVQFNFGKYELIGHVESVDINFQIDEQGTEVTEMALKLSRIAYQRGDMLDFVPMTHWGSLHLQTPPPPPPEPHRPSGMLQNIKTKLGDKDFGGVIL